MAPRASDHPATAHFAQSFHRELHRIGLPMIVYTTTLIVVCALVLFAILMDGLLAWIEAAND